MHTRLCLFVSTLSIVTLHAAQFPSVQYQWRGRAGQCRAGWAPSVTHCVHSQPHYYPQLSAVITSSTVIIFIIQSQNCYKYQLYHSRFDKTLETLCCYNLWWLFPADNTDSQVKATLCSLYSPMIMILLPPLPTADSRQLQARTLQRYRVTSYRHSILSHSLYPK